MSAPVFDAIRALLTNSSVEFEEHGPHEPVRTVEDVERLTGWPAGCAAKSIVLKVGEGFRMVVLPGDRKLKSKRLRKLFETKSIRFANADELMELTGLEPGAVPPFGRPILDLPVYADAALLELEMMTITPGIRTMTIALPPAEYVRVAGPEVLELTPS